MKILTHQFVEFIPETLEIDILYITIHYKTAVHLCVCGCGNRVVTPLSPTDWKIIFDGKTVSLNPSIGNWNFACKTHYWIIKNEIHHSTRWSDYEIESGRAADKKNKKKYHKKKSKSDKKNHKE